jgi:RHS repeat-associated protein
MTQATRGVAFFGALSLGAIIASGSFAQTSATRTSSFAYDAASGLLTQEVIEPNQSSLRLQTDYGYDAFGNKTQATVSGIGILTRSASTGYDSQGRFIVSATNAENQTETRQFDARFGQPTSHTGPNNLTTTWSYDNFGRKTLEVRPDGTRTRWEYLFCSGVNGGTASCPTGAAYLMRATPLAANGTTQIGPIGTVYFDRLDREIAKDIESFNGSISRIATEYDSFGRVQRKSRPYFVSGGTPQWTVYTYDALGRVTLETRPDSSTVQTAYHGLVTAETNALNQTRTITKNSQGKVVSVTDTLNKTTSYVYDPFGNLIRTTDPVGNIVTATYDGRGRKIGTNDPNLGSWTYNYSVLDELVSQVDAKTQTTTLAYDKLGRLVQRVEPDMTAEWVYDTAANGIGKLASTSITSGPETGYQRVFSYDSLSRPSQTATTIDGTTYTIGGTYDGHGRLGTVTYPSGFSVTYVYNSLGYVQQLTNTVTSQPYWTANARDAEQHLTQQTAGNGVVTTRSFNTATGRLSAITAGAGGSVQNMSYTYDTLGNLLTRADVNTSLSESFTYDPLNRLTSSTVGVNPQNLFSYDFIGNLTSKAGVGTYAYPAPGQPRPHGVLSISGSTINTTFTYDPNGNQTSGLGRTIGYTSYNKPNSITQGTRTVTFSHDMDHQRFKQVAPEGTTLYIGGFGIFVELYQTSSGNRWNEYLVVGKTMIGVRFLLADETVTTRYFHHDHLGSIAVITSESGAVVERNSHDAWGKRRFPNGDDDTVGSITSLTTQGYTGQEELTGFGLVHLNGRVYDPLVGRMMSADPLVPEPLNGQAWNRYSYVINNPLAFTDPSGYSWLSEAFHFVQNLFRSVPIIGAIIRIAAVAIICAGAGPVCAATVAAIASAAVAGITTGRLDAALQAGAIAGATTLAFAGVGSLASEVGGAAGYLVSIAGEAAVGCASAVASGSSCASGALASGVTAFAGPFLATQPYHAQLVGRTVLGGTASVIGGGKFANGAVTAAFAYLSTTSLGRARASANGEEPPGEEAMAACVPCAPAIGGAAVSDALLGTAFMGTVFGWLTAIGIMPDVVFIRPPDDAWDPNGPKAPGYPGGQPGYTDPKGGPNWVPNPNGPGYGWESGNGKVWVPTGWAGAPGTGTTGPAHGGPHWDVQDPRTGGNTNVRPKR